MKIRINKKQTELIKGLGILLIVLHNFFHWVPLNTGENEFYFNSNATNNIINIISNHYSHIINGLFSFFGHYGVQLFVFISGYGLSKSYIYKQQSFSTFFKKRIIKIYPAFLIGIIVLIIYNIFVYSFFPDSKWFISILYKVLMIHTLIPGESLSINGPWWFYGLIMQLYFLFIPLFYVIKGWGWNGFLFLLILSYYAIFYFYTPLLNENVYIMANAPGHVPEFALGILLALKQDLVIKIWHLLLALLIFSLGNFYFFFFPFTFICITFILTILLLKLFEKKYKYQKILVFYGKISMYIFAIHGFFRAPYFIKWAKDSNSSIKTIGFALLYLLSVTIVAYMSKEIYEKSKKMVKNIKKK